MFDFTGIEWLTYLYLHQFVVSIEILVKYGDEKKKFMYEEIEICPYFKLLYIFVFIFKF